MSSSLSIAILTTARSDFGLLKQVIRCAAEKFYVNLLVAGSHFLSSRGNTFNEINEVFGATQNISLIRIEAMTEGTTVTDYVDALANTQRLASRWFAANRCDFLLFLGDRWELWGVTLPAFLHGIPLAHISGGEVTEGVVDDAVRHAHTKISSLHLAATDMHATNLSCMGEEDWRISITGECGLDQIYDSDFASSDIIKSRYDVDLTKETFLVTFHPSTLDFETSVDDQIDVLLRALAPFAGLQLVFTAPGMEQGSQAILEAIHDFVVQHPCTRFVPHFGSRNYLAVMRAAKVVIGNSSSGLIEAPSLRVPAINIGKRQKNRIAADSVQHVGYDALAISRAIDHALTAKFQDFARTCPNPYDPYKDGKNSDRIIKVLSNALKSLPRERLLAKKFDTKIRRDQWNQLLYKCPAI